MKTEHAADKAQGEWTAERVRKYYFGGGGDEVLAQDINAALAAEREKHCKDCCCARSWRALGITDNTTNLSIPEHIQQLREQLAACSVAQQPLVELLEEAHHRIGDTAFPSLSARIVNALAKVKEGK